VVVVVNVVGDGDGDELNDASSGRADGHEPICTRAIWGGRLGHYAVSREGEAGRRGGATTTSSGPS
jgi:hypothetical protein